MQIPVLSDSRFYVYEHIRPDTGCVFYVGKGTGYRFNARHKYNRNEHWHRIVAKAGGFDVRFVAKDIDEELSFVIEGERIDQLRRLGVKLCNQTSGGDGWSGWPRSKEWREKIGLAHKGKIIPDEMRKRISETLKNGNYRPTDEARAKMIAARAGRRPGLGRIASPEERAMRSLLSKGNKSRLGQKRSAEERAKVSAALRGVPKPIFVCPHCLKRGGSGAMHRWHFDNCKKSEAQNSD